MKNRRWIAGLICIALSLSLTGCGEDGTTSSPSPSPTSQETQSPAPTQSTDPVTTPDPTIDPVVPEDPSLTELRALMGGTHLCALALVDYVDPRMTLQENFETYDQLGASGFAARWPFMTKILPEQCAARIYSELYCLVPRSPDACVTVSRVRVDDNAEPTDEVEEVLYRAESGEPIFFCAESNGWSGSNVLITVEEPGQPALTFNPILLANYGTLDLPRKVLPFTAAGVGTELLSAEELYGTWRSYPIALTDGGAEGWDGGEARICGLDIHADTDCTAFYWYCEATDDGEPGETIAEYSGRWHLVTGDMSQFDEGTLILEVTNTGDNGERESIWCALEPSCPGDLPGRIVLTHIGGDALLPGLEGQAIEFTASYG